MQCNIVLAIFGLGCQAKFLPVRQAIHISDKLLLISVQDGRVEIFYLIITLSLTQSFFYSLHLKYSSDECPFYLLVNEEEFLAIMTGDT